MFSLNQRLKFNLHRICNFSNRRQVQKGENPSKVTYIKLKLHYAMPFIQLTHSKNEGECPNFLTATRAISSFVSLQSIVEGTCYTKIMYICYKYIVTLLLYRPLLRSHLQILLGCINKTTIILCIIYIYNLWVTSY